MKRPKEGSMRSRTVLFPPFFLVPVIILLAACSGEKSALPTATDPAASADRNVNLPAPRCQVAAVTQIIELFQPHELGRALSGFARIDSDVHRGRTSDAVTDMYQEWQLTLDTYYAGKLRGGTSTRTQTATLSFGRALYCLVGLDGSTLTLGTTPLDADNVVQVVYPSPNDQTVVTGSKEGGLLIPGGTLSSPVTISISLLEGPFTFPAGPLNTKLDQYGPFFEFKVVPQQTFSTPVLAAACIANPSGDAPPSSVDIAHNVGNGIEILPTVPVTFLVCGTTGLAPRPSAFQLARSGDYLGAMKRAGSVALHLFAATPVYASAAGMGGKTSSFSPFGGVDTAVVAKLPANFAAQPQSAAAGSDVGSAPSVLVQTANGHTPLGGASVTFLVTTGGGSIGLPSNSSRVTTSTIFTDNTTGLATVPNWTLGASSANAVTGSASFTLPANISGFPTTGTGPGAAVVVSGSPVNFTATSTDVIPYQASGYLYLSGADPTAPGAPLNGLAPGFEAPGYQATPQNGWQVGTAAFASPNIGSACPSLASTAATPWANVPTPPPYTYMLVRKSYTLPAWWTSGLTLGIAIDNDFQAFIDGVNVTPTTAPGYDRSSGFLTHENCATRDSFTIPVSATGGAHVLAIRARDRGDAAYLDARITVAH
jgi:hypothetical protein